MTGNSWQMTFKCVPWFHNNGSHYETHYNCIAGLKKSNPQILIFKYTQNLWIPESSIEWLRGSFRVQSTFKYIKLFIFERITSSQGAVNYTSKIKIWQKLHFLDILEHFPYSFLGSIIMLTECWPSVNLQYMGIESRS